MPVIVILPHIAMTVIVIFKKNIMIINFTYI